MKIAQKLFISFLIISLLPLTFITLFSYFRFKELQIDQTLIDLKEISQSRITYLTSYFDDVKRQASTMARSLDVIYAMAAFSQPDSREAELFKTENGLRYLDNHFQVFIDAIDAEDLYLIDKNGTVVYTFHETHASGSNIFKDEYKDTILEEVFLQTTAHFAPTLSTFRLYKKLNSPAVFVGAPIFNMNEFIGVFAFRIAPTEIYKIFHDYTSLGESGEVLIGKVDGNDVLFVNPIRHKPDAAFSFKVPLGSNYAIPMQQAVKHIGGQGTSIDYRSKKIIAVWEYFEPLDLGVVVKIDYNEVVRPINYLGSLLLVIGFFTVLAISLIVLAITKMFTRPIAELQNAIDRVAKGDFNVELKNYSNDEIGELAVSFQKMTTSLKESTTSIQSLGEEMEKTKSIVRSKMELLSRVSHELRTPLGPIKDCLELITEGKLGEVDATKLHILAIAKKNVNRLHELIEDILKYENIAKGHVIYKFQQQDLNTVIANCLELYQEKIKNKNLSLTLDLDKTLPRCSLDKEKITNAISIFLDNAIKFTDEGGITIKTWKDKDGIVFEITDTGIGISATDLPKLFQIFRELKISSYSKKQGIGLGLVTAKEIIQGHDGTVWAESTPLKGTSFFFKIPVTQRRESWIKKF